MASSSALPIFDPFFLVTPRGVPQPPKPKPAPDLDADLKAMFPDLLVHGTRGFLLNATTALTRTAGKAHSYFSRLSQALAFERMVRAFQELSAPVAQVFAPFAGPAMWTAFFPASPLPAPSWGVSQSAGARLQPPAWTDYSAFLMPFAVLTASPMLDAFWGARI
jgi:hypothetical protein